MAILSPTAILVTVLLSTGAWIAEGAECKNTQKGVEYRGTLNVTKSGRTCQRWDTNTPHVNVYRSHGALRYPDGSTTSAKNFCRNPNNDRLGPWCYTTDPEVIKEYCDVLFCAKCARDDCRNYTIGATYKGRISYTEMGYICQAWNRQSPNTHNYTKDVDFSDCGGLAAANNYCRNPKPQRPYGPWCYVMSAHLSRTYQYCTHIPYCPDDVTAVESDNADVNTAYLTTDSGTTCQPVPPSVYDLHLLLTLPSGVTNVTLEVTFKYPSTYNCETDMRLLAYLDADPSIPATDFIGLFHLCERERTYPANDLQSCRFTCLCNHRNSQCNKVYVRVENSLTDMQLCDVHTCPR